MDVRRYSIDDAGIDWPSVLQEWNWLLPPIYRVCLLTKAGDLFIETPEGPIHMLDVGSGKLRVAADSLDGFRHKISDPDTANEWLMIPIIDALYANGATLNEGQCFSYRMLPIFGGDHSMANRLPFPIHEHFGGWGSIHRQVKDLPDGSQVVIKIAK